MAIHKLTAAKIAKLNKKGMYGDGGGLWLQVTNGGAGKSWCFRWKDRQTGNGRIMGLGALYKTDIDQARELAKAQWELIRQGLDPIAVRDGAKLDAAHNRGLAKTVNEVIDEFLNAKIMLEGRSENTKHHAIKTLKIARRTIGNLPIQKIDTKMIMDVVGLRTMWTEKHPTANNLLSFLERVFSLAIAEKYYTVGPNPARWDDHLEHMLPARVDVHRVVHHPSLPYKEVGRFMETLRSYEDRSYRRTGHPDTALILEYIVLTGCRVSEARLATWGHIDRQNLIWTVPKENHKVGARTGEPVLRPISKPMLAVLDEMDRRYPKHTAETLIFPRYYRGVATAFCVSTFEAFVRRSLGYDITTHGFRSTFTDWCRAVGYPKALYDAQTGHMVGNRTDRAYARDQLVDQRRPMMDKWAKYCSQPAPEPIGGTNIENFDERRRKTAS